MFMGQFLSKYQCGFWKSYIEQHCLLAIWELTVVDSSQTFRALLTDFSKAFHCLSHVQLIAKLNAFSFHLKALKLMDNSEGNERRKSNESYSFGSKFILECLKVRCLLRPILFGIFLNNLLILNDY